MESSESNNYSIRVNQSDVSEMKVNQSVSIEIEAVADLIVEGVSQKE